MVQRGAILSKDGVFTISEVGERLMSRIGIEVDELRKARALVLACSDWTEGRPHVAGSLREALSGFVSRFRLDP
jgi:hypothetical protein